MVKNVVFWQSSPSIHQAPMIAELSAKAGFTVTIVIENGLDKKRARMGWDMPDFGSCKVVFSPSANTRDLLISKNQESSIHIVSSIRTSKYLKAVYKSLLMTKSKVGVYSESASNRFGIKGVLSSIVYSVVRLSSKRSPDFILAVGNVGVEWYLRCGYCKSLIYQFGYFVQDSQQMGCFDSSEVFRIVYVGQMIDRKGVDILIEAFSVLNEKKIELILIGDGNSKEKLENLSRKNGVSDQVLFMGNRSNEVVRDQMKQADVLVLPSRHDGWGAVANEALSIGTPVIVSNQCGSQVFISNDNVGSIFPANDPVALSLVLRKHFEKGKVSTFSREEIVNWYHQHCSAKCGANYLSEIFCFLFGVGDRPRSPWLVDTE